MKRPGSQRHNQQFFLALGVEVQVLCPLTTSQSHIISDKAPLLIFLYLTVPRHLNYASSVIASCEMRQNPAPQEVR
jgi:hypothetical protein